MDKALAGTVPLMLALFAKGIWQIPVKAKIFWPGLRVMDGLAERVVTVPLATLPGRVTAMPPVLAGLEIVQLTETSRLPTEPCATDTYPVRAKGFLPAVRAAWPM